MKILTKLVSGGLVLLASSAIQADQVFLDDVIVDGSLCTGQDCINGESFGFDTIRVKENNLRVHFQDTSNSASFPTTDWRIVINDSSNGGSSYFAIEDSDAGRQVFRVDAGAPANSLRVDSSGDVGIGTANPILELHVADGDTPTLRLEQNGSSGFAPQTWDVAGNETNFFIRDVTNGSKLPFRIKPGAPSDAIYVDATGQVGFGTSSPQDDFHLVDAGPARIRLTNSTKTSTATEDPDWTINSNGTLRFTAGSDSPEMTLSADGKLTVSSGYFVNATELTVPDYVFESTYDLKSIEEQAKYMFSNKHLPSVKAAPPSEGQLDLVAQQLGMLEELEKAHIYISYLHEKLKVVEADKAKDMSLLEARLAKLENDAKSSN